MKDFLFYVVILGDIALPSSRNGKQKGVHKDVRLKTWIVLLMVWGLRNGKVLIVSSVWTGRCVISLGILRWKDGISRRSFDVCRLSKDSVLSSN